MARSMGLNRRAVLSLLVAVAMVIATVMVATPRSEAALGLNNFEIGAPEEALGSGTETADIIAVSNGAGAGGRDWLTLPTAGTSFDEGHVKVINDQNYEFAAVVTNPSTAAGQCNVDGPDEGTGVSELITTNGTKIDDYPFVPVAGSPSPPKNDICQVYLAYEIESGDTILYMGVVRRGKGETGANGTTAVGLELNKVDQANRAIDDLLVTFEFDGSGPVSDLTVRQWDGDAWVVQTISSGNWDGTSWENFGEVAVNLSDTNLLPPPESVDDCASFSSVLPYGFAGNSDSSNVGDWGGEVPLDIPRCGEIEITKLATPAPDVPGDYEFEWEISDNAEELESASGTILHGQTVSIDVVAGNYTLDEFDAAPPYQLDTIICEDGQVDPGDISVVIGQTVSCTIFNDASAVQVVKTGAGNAQAEFDFDVTGQTGFSLILGASSDVFLYAPDTEVTITETLPGGLPSWELTSISCVDSEGAVPVELGNGSVTFDTIGGEQITCTFVNEQDALITVIKNVVNNNGGDAVVADFPLFLNGNPVTSGVANAVGAGQYTVTETGVDGYALTSIVCVDDDSAANVGHPVTVVEGQSVTCTVTNDDIAPGLTLIKTVLNDSGGTAVPADFQLYVNGQEAAQGVALQFPANTPLTVTEDLLDGYLQTSLICRDNELPGQVVAHPVTLAPGQSVTCTIINDDRPRPQVTVVKTTTPASADVFSFLLTPGDTRQVSGNNGSYTWTVAPGSYQLTELTQVNWLLESVTCSAPFSVIPGGASFTLDWAQNITCTFSNTPALADLQVTKVDNVDPVELSDENPTGQIEYTMVVSNLGPAVANNVTMVDTLPDTVSYVSHSTTAGTCSHAAGVFTCSLGTIPLGGSVTVKVVVSTESLGSVTDFTLLNVVEVGSTSPDPVPGNNLANEPTEIVEVLAEAILPFTGFFGLVWGYIALALMALGSTLLAATRSRGRHVRRSALYRMILG